MSDWLKNLPPENYIYLLGGALLLVLVIVILTYVMRISREIAGKTLRMSEEILLSNDQLSTNLKIINHSYHDNEFTEVGMIYEKRKVIINEEVVKVSAREKEEFLISHEHIRELLQLEGFKIKGLKFYFENSIGKIVRISGKLTRKEIKKELKLEKQELKEQLKEERYESGQYSSGDRFVIFFQNLFGPIKRANHNRKIKRNKKIADRRAEKEIEQEREKLIEAQKLIYEQRVRENRKDELRKEYQIDELKANLEKLEQEEKAKEDFVTVEEIIEMEPTKKSRKERKKQSKEKEPEVEVLEDDKEKVEANEEQVFEEIENDDENFVDELESRWRKYGALWRIEFRKNWWYIRWRACGELKKISIFYNYQDAYFLKDASFFIV